MRLLFTASYLLFCALLNAQVNSFFVAPNDTDANYEIEQDDHQVVTNPDLSNDKLFFFIGGTNSTTNTYRTVCNFAADLGYDVINLSYPNNIPSVFFANSQDSLAFRNYRQEVCYGTPLVPVVSVDTLNSVFTRAINLLTYLDVNFPDQNWDSYLLDSATIDWSKVVVGGHSQGAGHAAYFAKQEIVDRVLMFSGPNDFSNFYLHAGEWLREAGATSINRHFAYLSLLDEVVDFDKQLTNIEGLGIFPAYDTVHVDVAETPFEDSRCLYTTQAPGVALLYHNATVRLSVKNNAVWRYMLEGDLLSSASAASETANEILVYPNPSASRFTLESTDFNTIQDIRVFDSLGKGVPFRSEVQTESVVIDLQGHASGVYFIWVDGVVRKVVKKE